MNTLEKRMVDSLKDLKENHYVVGVKAEFEAEGTRMEEALRLKEVVTRAGLELTIKIGGCEALKDIYDARSIGVNRIVAPMIESSYALKKYIMSIRKAYPEDERKDKTFLVNIETITGYEVFDAMLETDEAKELGGIVLGRVDMTGSLGMGRDDVNSNRILDIASSLLPKAKSRNMECCIGGGVAKESIPFFKKLPVGCLDIFETRKILFKFPEVMSSQPDSGILKAVGFELMWLKNKREFYRFIFEEDTQRIEMLEKRYKRLIEEAGGKYE